MKKTVSRFILPCLKHKLFCNRLCIFKTKPILRLAPIPELRDIFFAIRWFHYFIYLSNFIHKTQNMKKPLSKSEINITFVNSVYTFKLSSSRICLCTNQRRWNTHFLQVSKHTEKRSANRSDPHQFQRRGPENSRQMAGQPRGTAESRSFTPDRPDNRQCW